MTIDSHQHFWKYDPIRDQWIDKNMQIIRKDFLPEDLKPVLLKNNVDGCIAVQADQSESETEFLLDLASKHSFIKGVVGWVDLCAENIEERLAYYTKNNWFKGVRHILQAEDTSFMSRPSFLHGISKLEQFNLTYDILVSSTQLEAVVALVSRFPHQPFVIDHCAKPNIKDQQFEKWASHISGFSNYENVFCKISGLITEADWNHWTYEQITPYLNHIFHVFGKKRVLYGSDWPVCLLAGNYKEQLRVIGTYTDQFSAEDKALLMGGNAFKLYGLNT